ncbi:hypothetical protein FSP39_024500 [Pinctada imbricata]|uniref:Uncharacterized protein n=1 Tax=Pinctada imbricata TaxID=66713 RepID=A0AA89BUB2_PINIB|nr:hypothetical protein FSP39_024500 [Pinctada imbricata]
MREIDRLITNLTTGYNTEVRPPENNSEVLYVNCSFFIMSIKDYDDISGVLSVTGGVMMRWQDPRLTWNPADFSDIDNVLVKRSKIWTPDLYVINPANNFGSLGDDKYLVRFFSSGLSTLGIGDDIKTLCPSDMAYFPFDVQSCSVRVAPWTYFSTEIRLLPMLNTIDLTYFSPNNMWDIDSTSAERFGLSAEYNGMVSFTVRLRRKPLYFVISMMAPIFLLALLNPFVFLLPVESGERISFSVTIFLSFAVFMTLLSDNLPKSSTPLPIICYFLFTAIVYSGLITIFTMLLMRLHHADSNVKAPKWLRGIVYVFSFRCLERVGRTKRTTDVVQISEKHGSQFLKEGNWKRESRVEIARKLDKLLFIYSIIVDCLMILCMILILSGAP